MDIISVNTEDAEDRQESEIAAGVGEIEKIVFTQAEGIYFGDMMADDYDNYTFAMYTDGVTNDNFSLDGTGMGVMLDIYSVYGGDVNMVAAEYIVAEYTEADHTVEPGVDWGGMMSGTAIVRLNEGDKEYYYVQEGVMIVEGSGDDYTITCFFVTDDGQKFKTTYEGPQNMFDLAGSLSTMPYTSLNISPGAKYLTR